MNLLALDTSTLRAAVALGRDGQARFAPAEAARRHASGLVPAIRDLLREADLRPSDLDGLGVGLGPGSFTGLRVGLAVAKGLAYAVGCPLIGIDSMEAIARNAPIEAERIRVVVDAQRGELYSADFGRQAPRSPLLRLGPTRIVPAVDWLASLAPGELALGPALERPTLVLPEGIARGGVEANHPQGAMVLELTLEALMSGRRDDPCTLEPHYIRRSAAEEKRDGAP